MGFSDSSSPICYTELSKNLNSEDHINPTKDSIDHGEYWIRCSSCLGLTHECIDTCSYAKWRQQEALVALNKMGG